jgi:hypothetical protein
MCRIAFALRVLALLIQRALTEFHMDQFTKLDDVTFHILKLTLQYQKLCFIAPQILKFTSSHDPKPVHSTFHPWNLSREHPS